MSRTLLRKTSVFPLNNKACGAAAQRDLELFRLAFELISLKEKVAQAELTRSRLFSPAAQHTSAKHSGSMRLGH
ncbi:MAG TPA: hypothetical protein VI358_05620 [Pseudolabrys sp.]|jgi:hypothetical protein